MNGRSPWAAAGAGLPWSHPDADPLADVRAHIRRAEADYSRIRQAEAAYYERLNSAARSAAADVLARLRSEGVPVEDFPHFDLSLDLTAAEHLAAAGGLLHDAGAELVLAAKAGASGARYHARRLVRRLRRQAPPSISALFPKVSVASEPIRYPKPATWSDEPAIRPKPAWWSGL